MTKILASLALAGGLAAATLPGGAFANTYSASTWLPTTYAESMFGYTEFAKRVKKATNGEINFNLFFSGSLLPVRTTLTGIRDGVAQVGFIYPPYNPAELPISDFLNDASFLSDDPLVATLAYAEMNFTNPALKKEWSKFNTVFGGGYATPVYQLMCNSEVKGLAEAKGKRVRTAGGSFTALTSSLGATPVSVPIGDAYSGLQRGSLDCIMADPTNLTSASLAEVVKDMTMAGLGLVPGVNWAYNKPFWDGLTDKQRAILKDEMAYGMVETEAEFARQEKTAMEAAKKHGIKVLQPDEDLAKHIAAFKADYVKNLIANSKGKFGADPQQIFDQYEALQKKWAKTLQGVDRTDTAALVKIVNEQLMSKM